MSRALVTALLASAALLVAGCGGTGTSASAVAGGVAEIVPADAPLLVAIETDPDSEQWERASALLDRFPGKSTLLDELREELEQDGVSLEGDLLQALGDETYVVVTDLEDDDAVLITQPRDPARLAELLRESDEPSATRELNGWTLISEDEETLALFGEGGDRLDGADWFGDAQERVEEDALVTLLVSGAALEQAATECEQPQLDYVAGTITAEDDGVRLRFAAAGEGAEGLGGGDTLLEHVPSGAIVYLGSPSFDVAGLGLADQLRCALDESGAPDAEGLLGVSYDDVLDLFAGGFALSVRPAALVPEVTVLLEPADEARAIELLDTLVERAGGFLGAEASTRRIGDVEARELRLGPVTILYGSGDGRVVVTSSEGGFDAITGAGESLEDDEAFRDARDAAGVGEGADVVGYVDLNRVLELLSVAAGFADEELPANVRANLEPLESVLAWSDASDENAPEFGMFVAIR
jgi:hypothetical protein